MKRIIGFLTFVIIGLVVSSTAMAQTYKGKKILLVDSYHEGYAWSDGVVLGAKTALKDKGLNLKVVHMDTQRNTDEAFKQEAALKVKAEIEAFKPNVVIASDDSAAKYLVSKYYKDAKLPFVFCGLNWDASVYGMPYSNVTGMVEVSSVMELIDHLKNYAKGKRVGVVAADVFTQHKEEEYYRKLFKLEVVAQYAKTMAGWKKAITDVQGRVDILIIGNSAGIEDWNGDEAMQFLLSNTRVPSGTVYEHMTKYAMLGFTKLPAEQGFYAANTALKILDGISPASIPVVKNKEGRLTINLSLAKAVGAQIPYEIISSASEVFE
jgi:ABC-type uncharacterized transport system substrate-binding protein